MTPPKKKKSKKGPTLQHYLEYALIRAAAFLLGGLTDEARLKVARVLGPFAARFVPIQRGRIRDHLRIAFPELTEAKRDRLVPGIYTNAAMLVMETLAATRLSAEEQMARVAKPISGLKWMEELKASGQGFVAVSAHLASWERGAAFFPLSGLDTIAIVKPLHNKLADSFLARLRGRYGLKLTDVNTNPRQWIKHLRHGGVVGMLGDQDAGRDGIFVPFFGREASTAPGPAWFAYHFRVPIVMIWGHRTEDGKLGVTIEAPLWADSEAPADQEIKRLTAEHVAALERRVRLYPDQYFWFHRRWKSRPRNSKANVAGADASKAAAASRRGSASGDSPPAPPAVSLD